MKQMTQNDKQKNHLPDFKAKVALGTNFEEMSMAELSKKRGIDLTQIGTWNPTAIENMATAFNRKSSAPERVSSADVDQLHSETD